MCWLNLSDDLAYSCYGYRSSLSYGIPSRIQSWQGDMPPPDLELLSGPNPTDQQRQIAEVYISLASLTEVLYKYLETAHRNHQSLESGMTYSRSRVRSWSESTAGRIRRIVLRGLDLDTPGAANLRLAFLSVQFLHCRIALEVSRNSRETGQSGQFFDEYSQSRRAAEDIVVFVQELGPVQLQDIWLPEAAFTLCFVTSFLIRAAIEFEGTWPESPENGALSLSRALMVALRCHKEKADWDIGDICLEQYSELLDWDKPPAADTDITTMSSEAFDALDALITDATFQDALLFPMMFPQ